MHKVHRLSCCRSASKLEVEKALGGVPKTPHGENVRKPKEGKKKNG